MKPNLGRVNSVIKEDLFKYMWFTYPNDEDSQTAGKQHTVSTKGSCISQSLSMKKTGEIANNSGMKSKPKI